SLHARPTQRESPTPAGAEVMDSRTFTLASAPTGTGRSARRLALLCVGGMALVGLILYFLLAGGIFGKREEPDPKDPGGDVNRNESVHDAERFEPMPPEVIAVLGERRRRHWGAALCAA